MSGDTMLGERAQPQLPPGANDVVPLIELQHVSKSYVNADGGSPVTVLDDISLEVREGEILALLGQSGQASPPSCA